MKLELELIPITLLKPHEECIADHVEVVMSWLENEKTLITPLLVDKKTHVILDGHHRYTALLRLGYAKVPVFLVDYLTNEKIVVVSARDDKQVTKQDVIDAGLSGSLLPCKTSRHLIAPGLLVSPVELDVCR